MHRASHRRKEKNKKRRTN